MIQARVAGIGKGTAIFFGLRLVSNHLGHSEFIRSTGLEC